MPIVPSIKSTNVNPLDSAQIQKRGKEREKPKAKKQSTLKKVQQFYFGLIFFYAFFFNLSHFYTL
jgi:hypothetical protein